MATRRALTESLPWLLERTLHALSLSGKLAFMTRECGITPPWHDKRNLDERDDFCSVAFERTGQVVVVIDPAKVPFGDPSLGRGAELEAFLPAAANPSAVPSIGSRSTGYRRSVRHVTQIVSARNVVRVDHRLYDPPFGAGQIG